MEAVFILIIIAFCLNKEVTKMTARELRSILFNVENQNISVKELRDRLFAIEDQDSELTQKTMYELTK